MSVRSLGYLGFAVKDVPAWRDFMTAKLGLQEVAGDAEGARYRLDSRAWRIAVEAGEEDDLAYAGYEVADPAELTQMAERLRGAGVAVTEGDAALAKRRGVLGLITFTDPFGLPLEIYYGPSEVFEHPFTSPAGVSGFRTGEQGLGHFVRCVPDTQKALAFYTEALGFQLSDVIDIKAGPQVVVPAYFLHCNGRHHTLALASFPLPRRIHHFMIEANTLDDVGLAYDRIAAEDRITMTFGRHSNDHMVSFYAVTPSGFDVEFGWGARAVEPGWTVVRHDAISVWGHKPVRQSAPAPGRIILNGEPA
ncbi:biphenyl-2,3-diol 1,2-dioxygenase [Aerosticca soli]|uniref:2,3-dihydroxybiphenyl 1,2-dioxygenase n=1 Tax=Aerosticca soli TaxID=2010829 RepID=A0A2Z6E4Q8_9GAMM|nr:biphenyl-2,3-diol 1,2-dioxygenase [Aerosticca soli]BBD79741.1 2,3-dihydroxybiphenyl 1,2-dioxygenase [Aerosticca soli]